MNSSMNHTAPPASTIIYRQALRQAQPHTSSATPAATASTAQASASGATSTPPTPTQPAAPPKRPVLHLRRKHADHSPQS